MNTPEERDIAALRTQAIGDVISEYYKAVSNYPKYSSAHEGFGLLLEEVGELWAEVTKRDSERDMEHMRLEAAHVAAVALRIMTEVCD